MRLQLHERDEGGWVLYDNLEKKPLVVWASGVGTHLPTSARERMTRELTEMLMEAPWDVTKEIIDRLTQPRVE